ncbi:MAG TPA: Fur family transcriptional regulator [Solirubrobacteraceae bacterium]|jgi:Fe2+ or Zn2+ uptake regulation protein
MHEQADTALTEALRSRGLRVTPQRIAIARAVRDLNGHVTAEDVFGHVSAQTPGISLPTVYAALELLQQLGLVRRVATEGGTVIWDARVADHHHAVCRECGRIVDLDAALDQADVVAAARAAGFAVDDAQLVVRGLCSACRQLG